jgi:gluconate 2-dehydrogenase gamma chain
MEKEPQHIEQKLQDLLKSNALTQPTRKALQERIGKAKETNQFFNPYTFNLLSIVCDLLMDQDPQNRIVNIAVFIDQRLWENTCDGWRYDDMPPDDKMITKGLEGVDETSTAMFGKVFIYLDKQDQLKVLKIIQQGVAAGNTWTTLPATRFFEELLAEATEIFFSYPLVQVEIGYEGMADAAGWRKIGLNG